MKLATSQILDAREGEFTIDYRYPIAKVIVKKNGKTSLLKEQANIPTYTHKRDGTIELLPLRTGKYKDFVEESTLSKDRVDRMCRLLIRGVVKV